MKLLKTLLLTATAVLALSSAQASVISHNGFSRDSDAVVVSGYGQDWLMWDQTEMRSIQWLDTSPEASGLRIQGWHVADLTEMQSLFSKFQLGDVNQPEGKADQLRLIHMFGGVESYDCPGTGIGSHEDCADTFVRFKLDSRRSGFAYLTLAWEDDPAIGYYAQQVVESRSWWGGHDFSSSGGLALVRDSQVTQDLPEPSSMALFMLMLASLGARRAIMARANRPPSSPRLIDRTEH